MAVFTYLKLLTTSIKRNTSRQFYHHAKFCATHQVPVIVTVIFIVLPLCYPALNAYYLNPTSDVPAFYWESPSSRVPISKSSFQQKCGTQPYLHVEKIIIKTGGFGIKDTQPDHTNALEKNLLLWTLKLQERLAKTVVVYPPNRTPLVSRQEPEKYTLSSLCFKPNGGSRCLVHSPIEFWNYDNDFLKNDENISKTLSNANKFSSFKIPIPLESVFGNPIYDKVTGKIISADSIVLTYFLEDIGEGQTLAIWDLLLKNVMDANDTCHIGGERIKGFHTDFKETSNHIVFTFDRNKEVLVEDILLILEYIVAFLYILLSSGRLNSVKSKFGLTFSIVAQVFASFVVSLSICSLFGVTLTPVSWKLLPFVLVIVGIENMFVLTNAVISTPMELNVGERIGQGLEKVGVSMTKALFTGLFLLFVCSSTSIDSVQEFCIFTSVAMIIDYLLQMSFFITTLSIDLRRLEISDLYNRRVGTPLPPKKTLENHNSKLTNPKLTNSTRVEGFPSSSIAIFMMAFIFMTIIYQANGDFSSILSSLKSVFNDLSVNKNIVSNTTTIKNTFYETSTAVNEAFWDVVNPKKMDQYFEIRYPRKYTLLWTEPTEIPESIPLEVSGAKLSTRSIIQSFVWFLKFIISPAFGIILATSSLVGNLVSSDQIDKDASNGNNCNGKKISFYRSFMATPRVVTLRGCHSADISLLCANPNGMIISTATDKRITSWDGRRGVSLKRLERYMRKCDSCKCGSTVGMKKCISWPVRAMCMSGKIELAAAGFEDGVVRVWDINSGQAIYILKDTVEDVESVMSAVGGYTAKERVTCLQFVVPTSSSTPQTPTYEKGSINFSVRSVSAPAMLLAAYRDGYFREWDLISGQVVHTIATNQKGGISYLCIVDDGELDYNQGDLCIFTGARDGSVKRWIRKIYYSKDESNATSSTDLDDLPKSRWKSIYTIPSETTSAITCIATKVVKTADSTYGIVITGAADGEIKVYDYLTGKPLNILSQGTISKQRREQLLLQKRMLIRKQKLYNNSSSSDSDWYDDDFDDEDTNDDDELSHQDSITNIIINLLKQESCPCGNTEYGGFSVVTSSTDEKVHVWKLARNVMDCTCVALRDDSRNDVTKNGPTGRLQKKDVAKWNGVVSYQPEFIGRVNQPGGTAIVFIKENVVGVRKVKHSSKSKLGAFRCHGAEGEWEMWVLDINDPKVIEFTQDQENSDNEIDLVELSVQTIPLVVEADLFTEEQQKKKRGALKELKKRREESTGELKGFVRRRRDVLSSNAVESNFGPTFQIPSKMHNQNNNNHHHHDHDHDHSHSHHEEGTRGQVVDYRDYRQRSKRARGSVLHRVYPDGRQLLSLLDEEDEMNEFLPFAHVRQVVKIGDDGVAVAYGNFVKVVLFDSGDDL